MITDNAGGVLEQTLLRPLITGKQQQSEEIRSVGPTCSKCKCSGRMMGIGIMKHHGAKVGEKEKLEFCSLPPISRMLEESKKRQRDNKQLLAWRTRFEVRESRSSLKRYSCEMDILDQQFLAAMSSLAEND